jgi:hypothetical protein
VGELRLSRGHLRNGLNSVHLGDEARGTCEVA